MSKEESNAAFIERWDAALSTLADPNWEVVRGFPEALRRLAEADKRIAALEEQLDDAEGELTHDIERHVNIATAEAQRAEAAQTDNERLAERVLKAEAERDEMAKEHTKAVETAHALRKSNIGLLKERDEMRADMSLFHAVCEALGIQDNYDDPAAEIRDLIADRDALRAEVERLKHHDPVPRVLVDPWKETP